MERSSVQLLFHNNHQWCIHEPERLSEEIKGVVVGFFHSERINET